MTFGMKVLIGVGAGILVGVFFGEMTSWLDTVGEVYVDLLQMTVLPYVTVSLTSKIGKLTAQQAKTLAGRAGLVMLALWGIALLTVLVMPLSLPDWEAGTFFTASLVEKPAKFDFLGLYIPKNPFYSLANNIVPAVVVFSVMLGAALVAIPNKQRILDPLAVVSDALGAISNFIVRLSPYGTFALAAGAAGKLSPDKLARLSGYVSTYTLAIVLLAFIVLPGFAAALTPFPFRKILRGSREAVLTAFATGKLFACLPIVIKDVRRMLVEQGTPEEEAQSTADIYVPLGYPFPNSGKVLSILFLPFAAWFIGRPLEPSQYPMLLSVGLFAFFGSPVAAIIFMLDLLRLPSDLLPLFLIAGIWCARIGDVLGAVHLSVFTLICSAWNQGWIRLNPRRLVQWAAGSAIVTAVALYANHAIIKSTLAGEQPSRDIVLKLELSAKLAPIEVLDASAVNPHGPPRPGESYIDRIRRTGELRVGFRPDIPPFCYRNGAGHLVGFDVDLIQVLARDLGAKLVLVPVLAGDIGQRLKEDHFDLAIGGIPSTVENFDLYEESNPYLDLHAALLVRDHEVGKFRTLQAMREYAAREPLRIGYIKGGTFVRLPRPIKGAEPIALENADAIMKSAKDLDAVLVSAETGAVFTMLYPQLSVVIPEGADIRIPAIFPLRQAPELEHNINSWIRIRERDGTVERLYEYWVLGKAAQEEHKPRWSVIRDVLHWVD